MGMSVAKRGVMKGQETTKVGLALLLPLFRLRSLTLAVISVEVCAREFVHGYVRANVRACVRENARKVARRVPVPVKHSRLVWLPARSDSWLSHGQVPRDYFRDASERYSRTWRAATCEWHHCFVISSWLVICFCASCS